jgi:hypothetical protein
MSIVDNIKVEISPPEDSVVIAKSKANNLKTSVVNTYDSMTSLFNEGASTFWASTDCTPQEIADQLGTNASGVFYLHARLGDLLYLVDPSSIVPGLAVVGTYDNNEDGTITITSVPTGVQ